MKVRNSFELDGALGRIFDWLFGRMVLVLIG